MVLDSHYTQTNHKNFSYLVEGWIILGKCMVYISDLPCAVTNCVFCVQVTIPQSFLEVCNCPVGAADTSIRFAEIDGVTSCCCSFAPEIITTGPNLERTRCIFSLWTDGRFLIRRNLLIRTISVTNKDLAEQIRKIMHMHNSWVDFNRIEGYRIQLAASQRAFYWMW